MTNGDTGDKERTPPSAAEVARWQEQTAQWKSKRDSKKRKYVTGHITLPENKVIIERKPNHPAGHKRAGWWIGLRTTGTAPEKPGENQ